MNIKRWKHEPRYKPRLLIDKLTLMKRNFSSRECRWIYRFRWRLARDSRNPSADDDGWPSSEKVEKEEKKGKLDNVTARVIERAKSIEFQGTSVSTSEMGMP